MGGSFKTLILGFSLTAAIGWSQKPVIFPGGVVNGASYFPGNTSSQVGISLSGGSIVSIFGMNFATSTMAASSLPLPTQLGGTSVTANGIAAPLFYVSPGQINFQMPSEPVPLIDQGVVVTASSGASDLYRFGPSDGSAEGIFTLDASGCGRGAVLNVSSNGTLSVNSTSNSVSPGDYISVFGTGLYIPSPPPDGAPAPSNPPVRASGPMAFFDFVELSGPPAPWNWAGLAPGFVGLDQIDIQVPASVREGCAVPVQTADGAISQPVTISIRKGGGPCADPPSAGYGQITWEKAVTTTAPPSTSETDTVTLSFQASPGKQAPAVATPTAGFGYPHNNYFGPSCPVPGYRSLDAGAVTVQGTGLSPVLAKAAPLNEGQVSGLSVYQANLPAGAIQPGSFQVSAAGGADIAEFQSAVQIGSGIQVTTALAGRVISNSQPFTINWTGGDPNSWVSVTLVNHGGSADYSIVWYARASTGSLNLPRGMGIPTGPIEVIVQVFPDPSQVVSFTAPGLSLGGQHSWKYTYRFEGAMLQ